MITPNSHMNPVYGDEEIEGVVNYINNGGWIMEHTKTRELEKLICDYTKAKYAHMVPSATAGLLLASMVADIKPDEPFCSSAYTQAATVNGAILMGGKPVFIDIDPVYHTIDFNKIPEDCRVVFISSINGRYPPDIEDKINQLKDKGHFVIEDAAQSLGSWSITHKHCGTMGDLGVFSFGAPKIITTGQGGCIITNSKELSDRIFAIKNFGRSVGVTGETYNVMGMNFKFTDLQASFGVEQMKKFPDIVKRKKEIYNQYKHGLMPLVLKGDIMFPNTSDRFTTVTYPDILVKDPNDKYPLMKRLSKFDIGTRSVYQSLSSQPFHSAWKTETPNTNFIYERGIQLPGQTNLDDDDMIKIVNVIINFYAEKNRKKLFKKYYKSLYKEVDRLAVVITGQPRYVGTTEWEKGFVDVIKNTKKQHDLPIDIFIGTNHYDVTDKTTIQNDIVKQNKDNTLTPLRVLQTEKFEKYINTVFDFADSVNFSYIDPYYELENQKKYFKQNNIEYYSKSTSLQYFNPFFHVNQVYHSFKDYFDNLNEKSYVFRTRPDVIISDSNGLVSNESIWNLLGPLTTNFVGIDETVIGKQYQTFKFQNSELELSPLVLMFSNIKRSVLKGKIFSPDYSHLFDKDGFILFAKEISNYHINRNISPIVGIEQTPINLFNNKPEVTVSDFFIDNSYSMKFSEESSEIWGNLATLLLRNCTNIVDDHHTRWYDKL